MEGPYLITLCSVYRQYSTNKLVLLKQADLLYQSLQYVIHVT